MTQGNDRMVSDPQDRQDTSGSATKLESILATGPRALSRAVTPYRLSPTSAVSRPQLQARRRWLGADRGGPNDGTWGTGVL